MKRTRTDKPAPQKRKALRDYKQNRTTKNPTVKLLGEIPDYISFGSKLEIDLKASEFDGMTTFAADLMVRSALVGASDVEKMIVAAFIPVVLKFVRSAKKADANTAETSPGRTDGADAELHAD